MDNPKEIFSELRFVSQFIKIKPSSGFKIVKLIDQTISFFVVEIGCTK